MPPGGGTTRGRAKVLARTPARAPQPAPRHYQGPPPTSYGQAQRAQRRAVPQPQRTLRRVTTGQRVAPQKPAPRAQVASGLRNALLAAVYLRNSMPVGQNVGLTNLLANSRLGHGIAGAEAQQTWDKISALFPKGAKKPDLAFDAPSEAWAFTDRQNGKSTVHLNPGHIRDLIPHSPLASLLYGDTEAWPAGESQRRLVHEFAHSQQASAQPGPLAEGGAEAFSKIAQPVLNPKASPTGLNKQYKGLANPRYQHLADWYLKNFGARSVMRGQFTPPKAPKFQRLQAQTRQ